MTLVVQPTGVERMLSQEDIIVTKTDLRGHLTYTNDVFLKISAVAEEQALGSPHNFIRHPDMPAGIYKLLWDSISTRQELFAYVKNLALDGAHYWVLAHATPSYDKHGKHVGYHSMRRSASRGAIAQIEPVYAQMRAAETGLTGRARADASFACLRALLAERDLTYSQWIWRIVEDH
ncbi:PAS domain-containing protein [Populibacterium corticicola]